MRNHRTPKKSNPFYLPESTYLSTVYWCLQYMDWAAEVSVLPDTSKAISYDQDRVQTSNSSDATSDLAIRRVEIMEKMKLLEDTIKEVDESLYRYLLLGVGYGFTEYQLRDKGMPCGHNMYYRKRQQVYYYMNEKLNQNFKVG